MANIQNPAAYEAAIHHHIVENARTTFFRTYSDAGAIDGFLESGRVYDDGDLCSYKDSFVGSLAHALDCYGKLTEKQVEAVRKCIASRNARKAEWTAEKAALDATRQWVGEVGKRITLNLTCVHTIELDGFYGTSYLNICEDEARNTIIYKGNSLFREKGETATVTATVKEHGVRNGVKQTVIQRPKCI